jgi:predicted metalloprotease with PDZ domain
MSGELWLAEGFTSYYGALAMRRAGLSDDAGFARGIGGAANAVVTGPGRRFYSAVGMSRQAPFTDAAAAIDLQNRTNIFISYYTYGEAIAIGLDLTLRARSRGRTTDITLDDFMRSMWIKFGKPERPYELDDIRITLGEVTGDRTFADDYFRRYIVGQEVPDYAGLFSSVGLLFRRARPGAAWLGDVTLGAARGGVAITTGTLVGQPIYQAGLDRGDVLTSLGGRAVGTTAVVDSVVGSHRPGDTLDVTYRSHGQTLTSRIILEENPRMELVPGETVAAVTPGALEARRRWLASRAGIEGAPR